MFNEIIRLIVNFFIKKTRKISKMKRSRSTILIKHLLVVFGLLLCLAIHGVSQESDFDISDHHEESYGN